MPQSEPSTGRFRKGPSFIRPSRTPQPAADLVPSVLRPPLKWAGGKRWLVPELLKIWKNESHRRLVEPFCGGLAVTIGLRPQRALLNDVNPHLMNFYEWVKTGLSIKLKMENRSNTYYSNRVRFNHLLSIGESNTQDAAELFYYLNRVGYNGLCRFNRQGRFNVPFGRYKKIPPAPDFRDLQRAFKSWDFTHGDFEDIPLDAEDFIYADPPYDVEFTQYSEQVFDWEEQKRAARWLARHPGPVVLSNQATPQILALYKKLGFNITRQPYGRRLISCTGDRTPAREVLATRNL